MTKKPIHPPPYGRGLLGTKVKINKSVFIIGLSLLLTGYAFSAIVWFTAYFNNYEVLVGINWMNEAVPELMVWILTFPFVVLFVFYCFNDFLKRGDKYDRHKVCNNKSYF